jgi:hypothetical protein
LAVRKCEGKEAAADSPERKRMGFARLARPTYAGANMGHPYNLVVNRRSPPWLNLLAWW